MYFCMWVWLLSLSILILRFIHVVTHTNRLFFSIAKQYPLVCIQYLLFHVRVGGHVGCFQFGDITVHWVIT